MGEWLQRDRWQDFWRGGGGGDHKCAFFFCFVIIINTLIVVVDSSPCGAASQVSECQRKKPLVLFLRQSSQPTWFQDIHKMKA